MAEPARKCKDRVVQFPQQPGSEAHITMSEAELKEMIWDIVAAARKKKHKTKPTNSLYTKDGRIKPSPADPIRSKEDFQKLANYLASNGDPKFRLRNKAIFVFGCSLGIRCGDLLSLKTADVYEQDGSVKEHVELIEEKTRKRNVCKIPKMAADILEDYFDEQNFEISQSDYLFRSRKGGPLTVSPLIPCAKLMQWLHFRQRKRLVHLGKRSRCFKKSLSIAASVSRCIMSRQTRIRWTKCLIVCRTGLMMEEQND